LASTYSSKLNGLPYLQALRFKKQLTKLKEGDEGYADLITQLDEAVEQAKTHWQNRPKQLNYPDLPIINYKDKIVAAIKNNHSLVVAAETGSGKSTQLAKFCLEAGLGKRGKIAMVQPRRLGAMTIAGRIASELGEELGQSVGYKIRFDDKSSGQNFIELLTDGMLLAQLQRDKLLLAYEVIIVDEAHERSLNIDLLLGLLKLIQTKRPSLKVIISSATLDTQKFADFFNCPIIEAEGRNYPVTLYYRPFNDGELSEQIIIIVGEILEQSSYGDILVFLPTEEEINNLLDLLTKLKSKQALLALPLYARLGASEQRKIFDKFNGRKVIASTNIAETTLTIPGVKYVIDSGLARISQYNSVNRIQNLPIVAISKASANQRMGRAGRTEAGECYRLYSEEDFLARQDFTLPEIQRANLSETVLRMLALGITEVEGFPFVDSPKLSYFNEAFKTLFELGAITSLKKPLILSKLGRFMAQIPIDPRLSRILLEANNEGVLDEALTIVAALSMQDQRERGENKALADSKHKIFSHKASDFIFYLKLYETAMAEKRKSKKNFKNFCLTNFLSYNRTKDWLALREQLANMLNEKKFFDTKVKAAAINLTTAAAETIGPADPAYAGLHRALLSGFISQFAFIKSTEKPNHTAKAKKIYKNNTYNLAGNQEMVIFPASSLYNEEWPAVFSALLQRTSKLYSRTAAAFDVAWLPSLAGHLITKRAEAPFFSLKALEVLCTEKSQLYGLTIASRQVAYSNYNPAEATGIFVKDFLLNDEVNNLANLLFLVANQQLRVNLAAVQDKLRRLDIVAGDEAIAAFYLAKLNGVASLAQLNKFIENNGDNSLYLTEADLLLKDVNDYLADYPDELTLTNTPKGSSHNLAVSYNFNLGQNDDGYSLQLNSEEIRQIDGRTGLAGPKGYLGERIEAIIRALPKDKRVRLQPTRATSQDLAAKININNDLFDELTHQLITHYSLQIDRTIWQEAETKIQPRLRPRYILLNDDGTEAAASRNLNDLKQVKATGISPKLIAASLAKKQLEQINLTVLPNEGIPLSVPIYDKHHKDKVIGKAYPALFYHNEQVDIKLYSTLHEAELNHPIAVKALLQKIYRKEFLAIKNDITFTGEALLYLGKNFKDDWLAGFWQRHLYLNSRTVEEWQELASSNFIKNLWQLAEQEQAVSRPALNEYIKLRQLLASFKQRHNHLKGLYITIEEEMDNLFAPAAWLNFNHSFILRLAVFTKALITRLERATLNPLKDHEKNLALATISEKVISHNSAELTYLQQLNRQQAYYLLAELKVKTFTENLQLKGLKCGAEEIERVLSEQ